MRDLFSYRWAFRCTTDSSSDVVLGQGWATEGYTAADIDPLARGVGWLLSETGVPRRIKAAYLTDDDHQVPGRLRGPAARQGHRRMTALHALNGHDSHITSGPPGGPEHRQELVDTKRAAGGWSRTTTTPRSPAASCAPTPAASLTATSKRSPS